MEYQIKKIQKGLFVVRPKKDIGIYQLQLLKDTVQKLRDLKGVKNVIFDLKDVGYLDAFAVGVLTTFAKELRADGGDLKFANVNDDIKLLFDLSRLDKVFEIYNKLSEAEKSFK